jgi:hypothetical protein
MREKWIVKFDGRDANRAGVYCSSMKSLKVTSHHGSHEESFIAVDKPPIHIDGDRRNHNLAEVRIHRRIM